MLNSNYTKYYNILLDNDNSTNLYDFNILILIYMSANSVHNYDIQLCWWKMVKLLCCIYLFFILALEKNTNIYIV